MPEKTPFQRDIDTKAKSLQKLMDFAFGHAYMTEKGVTPHEMEVWINVKGYLETTMIWDKTNERMLIRVKTLADETRTFVMSELLELIGKERSE